MNNINNKETKNLQEGEKKSSKIDALSSLIMRDNAPQPENPFKLADLAEAERRREARLLRKAQDDALKSKAELRKEMTTLRVHYTIRDKVNALVAAVYGDDQSQVVDRMVNEAVASLDENQKFLYDMHLAMEEKKIAAKELKKRTSPN